VNGLTLFSFERRTGLWSLPGGEESGRSRRTACAASVTLAEGSVQMSRLGRNDWLVIGGMSLLFVALFLPWFRSQVIEDLMDQLAKQLGGDPGDTDTGVIGWHYALGWLAWLFTAAAAALVLLKLGDVSLPLPEGLSVMALGGVAFVLVLVRMLDAPTFMDRAYGILIGLLGAALVAFAGFLKNAETG
jgi:hypothetical protein